MPFYFRGVKSMDDDSELNLHLESAKPHTIVSTLMKMSSDAMETIESIKTASTTREKSDSVELLLTLVSSDFTALELVGSNVDDVLRFLVQFCRQSSADDQDYAQLQCLCIKVFKSLASAEVGVSILIETGACDLLLDLVL